MRAAHAYFSSPVRNYIVCCGEIGHSRSRHDGRPSPGRSPGPLATANTLKMIGNLAAARPSGSSAGFFFAAALLACPLHSVAVRGGSGRLTSFCASAAARRAVGLTEDPPFGGLWCDQPAIFFGRSCLRHLRRVRSTPSPHCRVSAASRRTIGTKVSKSTGLGTCRSKPASIAAATSPFDA
jgi:hypothetical protein